MATIFQLVERRRGSISNIISRVVSDSLDLINSLFPRVQLNYTRRMESQIVCSGCRVLLVYPTGASSIQCGSCNTIIMPTQVQTALVNCLNCHITLMYPYGAESVKCASCQHVTEIRVSNILSPITPTARPYNVAEVTPSTSSASSSSQGNNVTVVVENPMSLDEKGKLVNNLVVGVNTNKN